MTDKDKMAKYRTEIQQVSYRFLLSISERLPLAKSSSVMRTFPILIISCCLISLHLVYLMLVLLACSYSEGCLCARPKPQVCHISDIHIFSLVLRMMFAMRAKLGSQYPILVSLIFASLYSTFSTLISLSSCLLYLVCLVQLPYLSDLQLPST